MTICIETLRRDDVMRHQGSWSALDKIKDCCLILINIDSGNGLVRGGTKPLLKRILPYCQSIPFGNVVIFFFFLPEGTKPLSEPIRTSSVHPVSLSAMWHLFVAITSYQACVLLCYYNALSEWGPDHQPAIRLWPSEDWVRLGVPYVVIEGRQKTTPLMPVWHYFEPKPKVHVRTGRWHYVVWSCTKVGSIDVLYELGPVSI